LTRSWSFNEKELGVTTGGDNPVEAVEKETSTLSQVEEVDSANCKIEPVTALILRANMRKPVVASKKYPYVVFIPRGILAVTAPRKGATVNPKVVPAKRRAE
jgi:hypothetical protein